MLPGTTRIARSGRSFRAYGTDRQRRTHRTKGLLTLFEKHFIRYIELNSNKNEIQYKFCRKKFIEISENISFLLLL